MRSLTQLFTLLLLVSSGASGAVVFVDIEDVEFHWNDVAGSIEQKYFDINRDRVDDVFIEYSQIHFEAIPTNDNRISARKISEFVPSWEALAHEESTEIGAILSDTWASSFEGEVKLQGGLLNQCGGGQCLGEFFDVAPDLIQFIETKTQDLRPSLRSLP